MVLLLQHFNMFKELAEAVINLGWRLEYFSSDATDAKTQRLLLQKYTPFRKYHAAQTYYACMVCYLCLRAFKLFVLLKPAREWLHTLKMIYSRGAA